MATSAAAPRPNLFARHRMRPRLIAAVLLGGLLLGGLALWVRDSPLVSVDKVTVNGARGATGTAVAMALTDAAKGMTTLDVDEGALMAAVRDYPIVKSIDVKTHFPHGMTITVHQHVPVGTVRAGGSTVAVTADGLLLRGTRVAGLPAVKSTGIAGGGRLTDPAALRRLAVLAAATPAQRRMVTRIGAGTHGISLLLHGTAAQVAWFGDDARLKAKWIALSRVLADPGAKGAGYIDVRVPERPAAGGFPASAAAGATDPAATGASADPSSNGASTGAGSTP